jgi:hypothetical protein
MDFDRVERLKRDFTDKYVVVDERRPELARFKGMTGQVRTVNMGGRALVEFDGFANIGWYDIGLDFLKVVDKPPPKPVEDKHAAKEKPAPAPKKEAPAAAATGEKKLSPLEMARAQGAAKPAGGAAAPAKKASTADILAAARAGKSGAPTADKPAAAKPAAPPAAAKESPKPAGKLSTADILAAARGKKVEASAAAPAKEAPAAKAAAPKVEAPPAEEAAAEEESPAAEATAVAEPPKAAAAESKPAKAAAGDLPKTTADILAWCRRTDAKG